MVSGYTYTMLGFVATLFTLFLFFSDKEAFKRYHRRYFGVFLLLAWICILSLLILAMLSLVNYSKGSTYTAFVLMLIIFANTLSQVSFITMIVVNIMKRSLNEKN